jgi:DUF4097 and DUF4098 domain-containing protein YvlB
VSIDTSYRSVFVKGVGGRLAIDARNAEIEVREVKGDVEISNRYRAVTVAEVEGGVGLDAEQCEIRLQDIGGPIRIAGSYQPITVEEFRGSLRVETQHAPLTLSTQKLGGELRATTSYGMVTLSLPEDADFKLEARTQRGEIRAEHLAESLDRRTDSKTGEQVLTGSAGSGAVPVTVTTSFGDIEIVRSPRLEAEREIR